MNLNTNSEPSGSNTFQGKIFNYHKFVRQKYNKLCNRYAFVTIRQLKAKKCTIQNLPIQFLKFQALIILSLVKWS